MALIPLSAAVSNGVGVQTGSRGVCPMSQSSARVTDLSWAAVINSLSCVLFCFVYVSSSFQPWRSPESMLSHFDHVLPQSPHPSCPVLMPCPFPDHGDKQDWKSKFLLEPIKIQGVRAVFVVPS